MTLKLLLELSIKNVRKDEEADLVKCGGDEINEPRV